MTVRRTIAWFAALGAAIGTVAGCSGVADPGAPFALEFLRFPWPSVVAGDTLRDSTGAVAALRADVFDADGRTMPSVTVTYIPLDSGVRVLQSGRVVNTAWRTSPVRFVASAAGLQSRPLGLLVTRRPDTLRAAVDTPTVVSYDQPPSDPTNLSAPVQVRLRSRQVVAGASPDSVVPGWIVRFTLLRAPAATLADSVQLVSEGASLGGSGVTVRADRDTTDASGTAGIRVRVFPRLGQTAADSVVVQASAEAFGRPVPGSPVRLVVRLSRRTPP